MSRARLAAPALALLSGLALVALAGPAPAHELRPAFVDLDETADTVEITTTWPLVEAAPERIEVRLPAGCAPISPATGARAEGRMVERSRFRCPGVSLGGAEIGFEGLTASVPEVVVHATLRDRAPVTVVARRERPSVVLGGSHEQAGAVSFVDLGVRHILTGLDHLLFVLGLLLLVLRQSAFEGLGLRAVPWRRLLGAVTAFTCAHSVTLGLSTIGAVTLPPRGVEAAIALSILALAVELSRSPSPLAPPAPTAARRPWLLAFGFGLLHGFGFAGALRELGLPRAALIPALIRFNAGVELGQLAFVGVCLLLLSLVQRIASARVALVERVAVYGMGTLATYWLLGRTLTIFGVT
jgi:hypothetical protein